MLGKILTRETNAPRFKAKNCSGQRRAWQVYWRLQNWSAWPWHLPRHIGTTEPQGEATAKGAWIWETLWWETNSQLHFQYSNLDIQPSHDSHGQYKLWDGTRWKPKCPPNRAFVEPYASAAEFVIPHSLSLNITAKTTVPDVTGNLHASGVPVQKTSENPCYLQKCHTGAGNIRWGGQKGPFWKLCLHSKAINIWKYQSSLRMFYSHFI